MDAMAHRMVHWLQYIVYILASIGVRMYLLLSTSDTGYSIIIMLGVFVEVHVMLLRLGSACIEAIAAYPVTDALVAACSSTSCD